MISPIGSGSAAIVLCDRELSRTGNRLLGGVMRSASEHCELCQGGHATAADSHDQPLLMATDSETLMREGIAAARTAFAAFLDEMAWTIGDVQKTFCHQVGRAHQRLLFESLRLDPRIDFSTFEHLGNTGATALPIAAALGIKSGHLRPGDRVALLGIGSGINVIMLGLEWQKA